eukprot:jgi/Chlat1/4918/Chrsp31S04832
MAYLTVWQWLSRLLVATACSGAIGLEREVHARRKSSFTAGLRTHALVGIGSAIFTVAAAAGKRTCLLTKLRAVLLPPAIVTVFHLRSYQTGPGGPPSDRIPAQIVSGIGFLGGGVILKDGNHVRGLTTAASLWATASLGLACGAGELLLATVAAGIMLVILICLRLFEVPLKSILTKANVMGVVFRVCILDIRALPDVLRITSQLCGPVQNVQLTQDKQCEHLVEFLIDESNASMLTAVLNAEEKVAWAGLAIETEPRTTPEGELA